MRKNAIDIKKEDLLRYEEAYVGDPIRRVMTGAFSKANMNDLAFDPVSARKMQFKFSVDVKTMAATNQKQSGRCWIFAATNVLREIVAKELNLDSFELSQSYLAFWDKFERVNYYLESILDTAHLPADDRTVSYIVGTGVHDGGQWDMFVNIVNKYGIVPKDAMPETQQTSATGTLNMLLNRYLRRCTPILRKLVQDGADEETIRAEKDAMLAKCYAFLVSCYGTIPETFDFEYVDKDKNYHIEEGYTPHSFYEKFIGDRLKDYVSIIHAPTADKPFGKMYTVAYLGNVIGGADVAYLNLDMDDFEAAVLAQLKDGEIVWFGSDCGKYGEGTKKQWDDASYNYELISGLDIDMTKADMLDYHVSQMNHAMVITGVNLTPAGVPDRWKIENSWGSDGANGGYHIASESWFRKFVYQAVVHKKHLGDKAAILNEEPIVLNPWDPMGSLAD